MFSFVFRPFVVVLDSLFICDVLNSNLLILLYFGLNNDLPTDFQFLQSFCQRAMHANWQPLDLITYNATVTVYYKVLIKKVTFYLRHCPFKFR